MALAALTAGISMIALADGPTQPDPPVPAEATPRIVLAAASTSNGARTATPLHGSPNAAEPDCRCAVLHARDMESRVEGHIERFEAQHVAAASTPGQRVARGARSHHTAAPQSTAFVEGVVGFPVRDYRLAADSEAGNH
jgi:hypothetical protein